jgi:hypothetical protein
LQLPLIIIHITCISLSLHRTSAPIYLTNVLGVLGTQETSCILIAGLIERDTFDLFLPEFDKPWVIHLRETRCCSTNLCTWRPNTVYKNRSMRRHHSVGVESPLWRSDAIRLHFRHPCTPANDTFNKLRHAGHRVLREIPSRGLNQGKSLCVLCLLSGRDEGISPMLLPDNLGGVSPGVRGHTQDRWPMRSTNPS